jgi:hypothetical protein
VGTMASPRMSCSSQPSVSVAPATPPPRRDAVKARPAPSLSHGQFIEQESSAELMLIRRGEAAALARINALKTASMLHERNIAVLNDSLSAQHELLTDVQRRVTAIVKDLPRNPMESQERVDWESVLGAIHQLDHRLSRGAGRPNQTTPE